MGSMFRVQNLVRFFCASGVLVFRWGAEKRPTNRCVSHLKTVTRVAIWGFPKIGGTPKWMLYNGKPYIKNGWFGGKTDHFRKHPFSSNHPFVLCGHLRNAMEIFIISALLNVETPGKCRRSTSDKVEKFGDANGFLSGWQVFIGTLW